MSWGSLRLDRARPGAGLDGAELPVAVRGPYTVCARPVAAPVTVHEGLRAELRARLRHEVNEALAAAAAAGQEIDPTPSSRPAALARMGIGAIEMGEEEAEADRLLQAYEQEHEDVDGYLREVRRG